jgi:hypothetical protein
MWAVQGIVAALYERQRSGLGRLVECSLLETAIGFSSWTSAQWLADHEELTRQGLAPSPERTLPAHADEGRLSDDGRRRSGDLDTLRRSTGAPGMVRGPAVCDQRTTDAEPCRTRSRDGSGADDRNQRSLGGGAGGGRRALRPGLQLRAAVRRPAGAPPRPDPIRERPGFGQSPAHPHPDQDRRGRPGGDRRPQARPAQCRDLRPARGDRKRDEGAVHRGVL